MIVPTMTLAEVATEIQSDYKEVINRWEKFEPKFNRIRMKKNSYPWFWETTVMTKRKNDKALDQLIKDARIDDLKAALPDKDNSLYMGYLRDLLYHPASADYSDFLITKFENEAEKDVSPSKMLAKIGPVLGLIGTLISMSPALVGLSTGDISGMAYNMQVVFATTVVGLVISAVGLISMQFKQRWYAKDVNNLDYVSRVLNETTGESNNEKK